MPNPFAPPSHELISYTLTNRSAHSRLTDKVYKFGADNQSRQTAIQQLKDDDSKLLNSIDAVLAPHLGRQPSFKEARRHVTHGDVLEVDDRSLRQRVFEDAIVTTNDDPNEGTVRRMLDDPSWDKTPGRRKLKERLLQEEDERDRVTAEIEAAEEKRKELETLEWEIAVSEGTLTCAVMADEQRRNNLRTLVDRLKAHDITVAEFRRVFDPPQQNQAEANNDE